MKENNSKNNLIITNEKPKKCERAFLICIQYPDMKSDETGEHLNELSNLVKTMGIPIVGIEIVKLKNPNSKFLIGKGKLNEIIDKLTEAEADLLVFDDELSPSQQRNLEKITNITVIERREVILDIFADRASTREAVLQVGLARMNYSLPRLTRAWTHLSRQKGGAKGTRGEGETQLEVDKRLVLKKITHFKKELKKVREHRATQRKKRQRKPIPTISIVGYTNAGKSSLLNALTEAEVLIEDKLFATLDPTTRKLILENNQELLLTDTVGFIRKLPHDLVDAFKSTLEETTLSDFLIHVLDASNPEVEDHLKTTLSVLKEIDAFNKPIITVFNKIDLINNSTSEKEHLYNHYPDAIFISTKTGYGLEKIKQKIQELLEKELSTVQFTFPQNRHDLAAKIHRNGKIISEKYDHKNIIITAQVPQKVVNLLKEFIID